MQGKPRLLYYIAGWFIACLCLGCHSGPVFSGDAAYRAIEREAAGNSGDLAVTGAEIAAGVGRIGRQAGRTAGELSGLEGMIRGSSLGEADKSALLRHVSAAQEGAGALAGEAARTGADAERLNAQLARQREISAALSEEHGRREADGAAVKEELAVTKEKLAKTAGQRDLAAAVAIALALAVIGYAAFKVCRFLKIIPL